MKPMQHRTGGLHQLEGLPLRLIALKCSNPGPLAASCTAAHRSISTGGDFDVEWFLRWVHVLAPLRPWQYAAVCWRRLGGTAATAEQLCSFILRVCDALREQQQKQQQQQQPQEQPAHLLPTASESSTQQAADQQQQEQQQPQQVQMPGAQLPQQSMAAVKQPRRVKFGAYPRSVPRPSLLKQARSLLSKGAAVLALAMLCPGPGPVLLLRLYAALGGNKHLLQQLVSSPAVDFRGTYPDCEYMPSGGGSRLIHAAQLCACAAMQGGHAAVLGQILYSAGASFKYQRYQVGQLFRFACRHSTAACLQQLQDFVPCKDYNACPKLQPWPQHLAMAAARVDPWAAGVVQHLLQTMWPKLLAAKYMGPVYTAACRTGHMPVLQQLLQLAAAAPQQHLPVLLKAAAAAGNLSVWQHLLVPQQDMEHSSNSSAGGSHPAAGPVGAAGTTSSSNGSKALQAPAADISGCGTSSNSSNSSSSSSSRLLSFFTRWLTVQPAACTQQQPPQQMQQQHPTVQQEATQQDQSSTPAASHLPDLCWDLVSPSSWAAVLHCVLEGMQRHDGAEVLDLAVWMGKDQDRATMADQLWELLGQRGLQAAVRSSVQEQLSANLFPWASYGQVQLLLSDAVPGKVAWLLQHQMLPDLPPGWQVAPTACDGLHSMIRLGFKFGQRQVTACLMKLAQQLQVQVPAHLLVQGCLDTAAAAAGAARDGAAVQQLDDFAAYASALTGHLTYQSWLDLAGSEHVPDMLLLTLSAVWATTMCHDATGAPGRAGIPLQQQVWLAAAEVLPHLLSRIPSLPSAAAVADVIDAITSTSAGQQHTYETAAALTERLQASIQLDPQAAVDASLLRCLHELAEEWQYWLAHGPKYIPVLFGDEVQVVMLSKIWPLMQAMADGIAPGDHKFPRQLMSALRPPQQADAVVEQVIQQAVAAGNSSSNINRASEGAAAAGQPQPSAGSAGAGHSGSSVHGAQQQQEVSAGAVTAAATAAAHAAAAGGGRAPGGLAAAQQPSGSTPPARANGAAACFGLITFVAANRCMSNVAKAVADGGPTDRTAQCRVMPLWQHAALALAATQPRPARTLTLNWRAVVAAALQPPLAGAPRTPGALPALVGSSTPAEQPAPPEGQLLQQLMTVVQQRSSLDDQAWSAAAHRPDVLAWASVSNPRTDFCQPAWWLLISLSIVGLGHSANAQLLADHQQQQLQEHLQQREAGVTEGFGALPCFAAIAAEAAQRLLQVDRPPLINSLVHQLRGGSSAGLVEHVKAVVAATLAAPPGVLRPFIMQLIEASGFKRVVEAGDVDLLALLLLLDERVSSLHRFW